MRQRGWCWGRCGGWMSTFLIHIWGETVPFFRGLHEDLGLTLLGRRWCTLNIKRCLFCIYLFCTCWWISGNAEKYRSILKVSVSLSLYKTEAQSEANRCWLTCFSSFRPPRWLLFATFCLWEGRPSSWSSSWSCLMPSCLFWKKSICSFTVSLNVLIPLIAENKNFSVSEYCSRFKLNTAAQNSIVPEIVLARNTDAYLHLIHEKKTTCSRTALLESCISSVLQ